MGIDQLFLRGIDTQPKATTIGPRCNTSCPRRLQPKVKRWLFYVEELKKLRVKELKMSRSCKTLRGYLVYAPITTLGNIKREIALPYPPH